MMLSLVVAALFGCYLGMVDMPYRKKMWIAFIAAHIFTAVILILEYIWPHAGRS